MIFSDNTDRTGSRLVSIVNGLLLSKLLNVSYKIVWKPYQKNHSEIDELDNYEIFSVNFKKKYIINKSDLKTDVFFLNDLDFNTFNNEDLIDPKLFYKYFIKTFKSNQIGANTPWDVIKFLKNEKKRNYYDHVLSELEFSEEIKKVKIITEQTKHKYNAINIRAGDILYSAPQVLLRFHNKAFPALNAVFIIENKLIDDPVLFGEELDLQNKLSDRFQLKEIKSSEKKLNYLEKLFFEIFLQAKANSIVADTSRFAVFASFYGQNKLINFNNFINANNFLVYKNFIFTELKTYSDWYSSEQKAFAFLNLYHQAIRLKIKENCLEGYLLECIKYKDDEAYNIFLLDYYVSKNDLINADKIYQKFNKKLNIKILKKILETDWFRKKFTHQTINFLEKNLL
jgi:hypothetical protein